MGNGTISEKHQNISIALTAGGVVGAVGAGFREGCTPPFAQPRASALAQLDHLAADQIKTKANLQHTLIKLDHTPEHVLTQATLKESVHTSEMTVGRHGMHIAEADMKLTAPVGSVKVTNPAWLGLKTEAGNLQVRLIENENKTQQLQAELQKMPANADRLSCVDRVSGGLAAFGAVAFTASAVHAYSQGEHVKAGMHGAVAAMNAVGAYSRLAGRIPEAGSMMMAVGTIMSIVTAMIPDEKN